MKYATQAARGHAIVRPARGGMGYTLDLSNVRMAGFDPRAELENYARGYVEDQVGGIFGAGAGNASPGTTQGAVTPDGTDPTKENGAYLKWVTEASAAYPLYGTLIHVPYSKSRGGYPRQVWSGKMTKMVTYIPINWTNTQGGGDVLMCVLTGQNTGGFRLMSRNASPTASTNTSQAQPMDMTTRTSPVGWSIQSDRLVRRVRDQYEVMPWVGGIDETGKLVFARTTNLDRFGKEFPGLFEVPYLAPSQSGGPGGGTLRNPVANGLTGPEQRAALEAAFAGTSRGRTAEQQAIADMLKASGVGAPKLSADFWNAASQRVAETNYVPPAVGDTPGTGYGYGDTPSSKTSTGLIVGGVALAAVAYFVTR